MHQQGRLPSEAYKLSLNCPTQCADAEKVLVLCCAFCAALMVCLDCA